MKSTLNLMLSTTFLLSYFTLSLADNIDYCRKFVVSPSRPINSSFFGGQSHGYFTQFVTRDGDYELRNVIKFNVLSPVTWFQDNKTALCVSIVDTTSYTKNLKTNNSNAIAWVTMNTDSEFPTGVVLVDEDCWSLKKDLVPCNPQYLPMPNIMDTPLYRYSPLSRDFWLLLKEDHLFARDWVWRMNTQSKEEKFPSSWVSNIQIRSLRDLQIIGNNWGRPEILLSLLPNLERLDLTDNNIETLPSATLLNTPRLRDLLLARNNLSVFPEKLNQLPMLRLLDLTNPKGNAQLTISDSELSGLQMVDIMGLENVNLNANVTNLLNLQKLRFLNLSGCGIDKIDDVHPRENISEEKSLEILDLSNNNLITLPSTLFSSLTKLKSLRLQLNKLEPCPMDSLTYLNNLDYLDLSSNNLIQLEKYCFGNSKTKLQYLDLSWNHIRFIDEAIFYSMSSLKTLKLTGNELTLISPLTFSRPNAMLQTLDLSRNHISEWREPSHIKTLNLSYNAFTSFTEEVFEAFGNVSVLDLGGNSFSCCDGNLTLFKTWFKETHTDVRNLGTKDLLQCVVPGEYQKYPIRNFVYELELCEIDAVRPNDVLLIVMGALIVIMFILIIALFGIFYHYRNRIIIKKFFSLP